MKWAAAVIWTSSVRYDDLSIAARNQAGVRGSKKETRQTGAHAASSRPRCARPSPHPERLRLVQPERARLHPGAALLTVPAVRADDHRLPLVLDLVCQPVGRDDLPVRDDRVRRIRAQALAVAQRAERLPGAGRPGDDRAGVLRGPGSRGARRPSWCCVRGEPRAPSRRAAASRAARSRGNSPRRIRSRSSCRCRPSRRPRRRRAARALRRRSGSPPTPAGRRVPGCGTTASASTSEPSARALTNAPAGGFGKRCTAGATAIGERRRGARAAARDHQGGACDDCAEHDRADCDERDPCPAAHRDARVARTPAISVAAASSPFRSSAVKVPAWTTSDAGEGAGERGARRARDRRRRAAARERGDGRDRQARADPDRADGARLRRARAARGRAGDGQDGARARARRLDRGCTNEPGAVHPGHPADRCDRALDLGSARAAVRLPPGSGLRERAARRRDQPRDAEDPVGAARGDGRAAGDRRRRDTRRCPRRSS